MSFSLDSCKVTANAGLEGVTLDAPLGSSKSRGVKAVFSGSGPDGFSAKLTVTDETVESVRAATAAAAAAGRAARAGSALPAGTMCPLPAPPRRRPQALTLARSCRRR